MKAIHSNEQSTSFVGEKNASSKYPGYGVPRSEEAVSLFHGEQVANVVDLILSHSFENVKIGIERAKQIAQALKETNTKRLE